MCFHHFRRARAFTLVELLIVITIIVILATLLAPVLANARRQGSQMTCQNNMRQLTQSVLMYAADNDGQLPYCNWSDNGFGDSNAYSHGWLFTNNSGWNQAHPPEDGMKTGVLWPYNQSQQIYHCNLDDPAQWTGSHWLSSYTMNGAQCGYGLAGYGATRNVPGFKLIQFTQPAQQVLLWEATDPVWNDGSSYPSEVGVTDRHYKGGNMSFIDGHTEWWRPGDYFTQVGMKPGRLWCDPATADGT